MHCVSSLVVIYSVVHFKTNGSLEKRYKVKSSQTSALRSQSTLEKEFVVHWGSFKFVLLLFTTWSSIIINTRSLGALVAIMHDVFPARWLRPGNPNLWSCHHWRMSLHLLCQTRVSVSFQSVLWLIYKRLCSSISTKFAYGITVWEWLKVYHTGMPYCNDLEVYHTVIKVYHTVMTLRTLLIRRL